MCHQDICRCFTQVLSSLGLGAGLLEILVVPPVAQLAALTPDIGAGSQTLIRQLHRCAPQIRLLHKGVTYQALVRERYLVLLLEVPWDNVGFEALVDDSKACGPAKWAEKALVVCLQLINGNGL